MSIVPNQPLDMTSSETYQCPHCNCSILVSNEPTHDAICSRRHAGNNQRQAQAQAQPQVARRESSSSGYPQFDEPMYSNRRPQIREERNMASNKLITCPNCEKSIREQNMSSHLTNECQGSDKIPCEFCDQAVPLTQYTQHIEDAHRRDREEEQERHLQRRQQQQQEEEQSQRHINEQNRERPVSPPRGGMPNQNEQQDRQPRENSAERNATEGTSGGFMGFLKNLVHAATSNRNEPVERPQQDERPREAERHLPSGQGSQSNSGSLLSRLLGGHHESGRDERSRPMTMEDFFLQAIQRRQEAQRAQEREREMEHPLFSHQSRNPFMSQQPSGNRSVRTIRLGPHGNLVISSSRGGMDDEEEDVWQSVGAPQRRRQDEGGMEPMNMGEMGPMGLLLQMLAARGQGMPVEFNLNPEQMAEIESKGMTKEDIESLSVVKYDAQKNKNLSEDMKSCPICLDEFEDGIEIKFLWCLHRFHKKCIDQWLEKNTNCPICKKDFSEMDEVMAE